MLVLVVVEGDGSLALDVELTRVAVPGPRRSASSATQCIPAHGPTGPTRRRARSAWNELPKTARLAWSHVRCYAAAWPEPNPRAPPVDVGRQVQRQITADPD